MGIQVRTGAGAGAGGTRSKLRALALETSSSSSEMGSSPGTKTPNLVARLMGLDLLPDNIDHNHSPPDLHTPSSHRTSRIRGHRLSSNSKTTGSRSLPESPRVSSARKSDFDIHRLSLQLNKENKYEEFGNSRLKELKQEEECRSPRGYARQIVNQIKERVITRRVGMDITNTIKTREADPGRNHSELKRNSPVSCFPRDRFPEKEKKIGINQKTTSPSISRPDQVPQQPKIPPRAPGVQETLKRVKHQQLRPVNGCKKEDSETMSTPRPKTPPLTPNIRNKHEEVFFSTSRNSKAKHYNHLDKKRCKKNPVSNDLNSISVASIVPVKKVPSHLASKPPHNQVFVFKFLRNSVYHFPEETFFVPKAIKKFLSSGLFWGMRIQFDIQISFSRLPSIQAVINLLFEILKVNESHSRGPTWNSKPSICSSQKYKHEENPQQVARNPNPVDATTIAATCATVGGTGINVEREYITRILSYAGIANTHSPISSATWFSHPHPLDLSIFRNLEQSGQNPSGPLALQCNRRLLFDLVNEILVGVLNPNTKWRRNYNVWEFIGELCSAIASYPRASFPNPEEIDALFAGNPPETKKVGEEGEGIVAEIERDIIDALLEETASDLYLYRTNVNVGLMASA